MAEFKEVMKKKDELCGAQTGCLSCPLYKFSCTLKSLDDLDKIEEIVMNWEKPVDWSNVKVDTKILVGNDKDSVCLKRYFAKFEDGNVYTFCNGKTSWTTKSTISWEFAKLWEGEEK